MLQQVSAMEAIRRMAHQTCVGSASGTNLVQEHLIRHAPGGGHGQLPDVPAQVHVLQRLRGLRRHAICSVIAGTQR